MKKGKIIVIEGTDCSGKETQSKLLIDRLNKEGKETIYYSFPAYDTPTGKIIGLPYLGKPYLARELIHAHDDAVKEKLKELYSEKYDEKMINKAIDLVADEISTGWFKEGAPQVDPKISSLYYAADRAYNINTLMDLRNEGKNIILDRYTYSNMAHQGGKIENASERLLTFKWIENLEFQMLRLPEADTKIFLHMPTDYATFLRQGRKEELDENERDINHLYAAEKAYIEVADFYKFDKILCVRNISEEPKFEDIKTKEEISEEVYNCLKKKI